MAFVYFPVQLFNEEDFKQCIVVPFPTNGKIVDLQVSDKTVFLLVEAAMDAAKTFAHFHVVPVMTPLFADSHKYIGTVKIDNFAGTEQAMLSIIQIPNGDFGIHSQEYMARFGTAEHDKFVAAQQEQTQTESEVIQETAPVAQNDEDVPDVDSAELRSVWDIFDGDGKSKLPDVPKPKRKRTARKNQGGTDKTPEK